MSHKGTFHAKENIHLIPTPSFYIFLRAEPARLCSLSEKSPAYALPSHRLRVGPPPPEAPDYPNLGALSLQSGRGLYLPRALQTDVGPMGHRTVALWWDDP